jgi:cation transport ATPase/YHS domain-containing protein
MSDLDRPHGAPSQDDLVHRAHIAGPADEQAAIDPVCGMKVKIDGAKNSAVHGGDIYYFCSARCLGKFTAEPLRYLKLAKVTSAAPEPAGTSYTCPMHPQIRQAGPGSCPICGMALEPELVSADSGPNPELADMKRRFWVGLVLAVPVIALEMGGHLTNLHMLLSQKISNWLQFGLATPTVLWAGWRFFERAWQSLKTRNLNMFTLIAMGVGIAWIYSVVAIALPDLFPPTFRGSGGAVAIYFEAAAVITVLVLLGQVLELRARDQTSGAIRALLDLAPKMARRLKNDGGEEELSLDAIVVDDRHFFAWSYA